MGTRKIGAPAATLQSSDREYPATPHPQRNGCKVAWRYYEKREDAEACSEVAKHNARFYESNGYDFGFCCPGSVIETHRYGIDLFEVCIP